MITLTFRLHAYHHYPSNQSLIISVPPVIICGFHMDSLSCPQPICSLFTIYGSSFILKSCNVWINVTIHSTIVSYLQQHFQFINIMFNARRWKISLKKQQNNRCFRCPHFPMQKFTSALNFCTVVCVSNGIENNLVLKKK